MEKTEYSLASLWPDFGKLFSGAIGTPEGLSALFVGLLLALSLAFALLSIVNYFRASAHLKFYRNLIKGLSVDQLVEKRRDLFNEALNNDKYGRLWREFDESLVLIPHKDRLCNTLDAAHFFNTHSLARGLTENRLLAAVPGFLTAIGVIGTFVGLQLGLAQLHVGSGNVENLTTGIGSVIDGASIAFLTSVWGVASSVCFNFFEKVLERNIRSSITSFQNDVDYLYPRITAEQSLAHIEDFTKQSNERLAELDEKIGNKMQEALQEASGVISDGVARSLNHILGPAIDQLVKNAHSGSEKALESLLERFLDGIGNAGASQKEMMERAASDMAQASSGMTSGLNDFASKLEQRMDHLLTSNADVITKVNDTIQGQLREQGQKEAERQGQMTATLENFMAGVKSQLDLVAEQNAETLKVLQTELSEQMEQQQGREIARQKVLHGQLKTFQDDQEKVSQSIDGLLEAQRSQNAELINGMTLLAERFQQLANSHQQATSAMQGAATELQGGSVQLGMLSSNIKAAVDTLGQQLTSVMDQVQSASKDTSETANLFNSVVNELKGAGSQISEASAQFSQASARAEGSFVAVNQHFDTLSNSLREHIAAVENQVAQLLTEYSERVQSQTVTRLNTWNEQTNNYISSMTDAVRTLSGVVDEIDDKVSRRRRGSLA